jgi:hypothetical protein
MNRRATEIVVLDLAHLTWSAAVHAVTPTFPVVPGGMIALSSASFGDSFTLNRSPAFGTIGDDHVTFTITLTGSTTSDSGPFNIPFFNVSALGLVIAESGTLVFNTVGSNSPGRSCDFDFSQTTEVTFEVPPDTTVTSASGFVPGVTPRPTTIFLRGSGATANLPVLFLDTAPATDKTAKSADSGAVSFKGTSNPWAQIGTWQADPLELNAASILGALLALHVWLGLRNSDDQGTSFDLKAEVYQNGNTKIAEGLARCIKGITRNPANAKEVALAALSLIGSPEFNGTTDGLSVKLLTRIGTNADDTRCPGLASAVGIRAYFDAVGRDARLDAVLDGVSAD